MRNILGKISGILFFILLLAAIVTFSTIDRKSINCADAETYLCSVEFSGETVYFNTSQTLSDALIFAHEKDTTETNPAVITLFQNISLGYSTINQGEFIELKGSSAQNITITRSAGTVDLFKVNGTLTLSDIIIDGAKISTAKTLFILSQYAKLVLNANSVLKNNYSSGNGGAVKITGGILEMNGGTIIENKASSGGAVYMASGACFKLNEGLIEGNYAKNGGAVYTSSSNIYLYGGEIKNNVAESLGGGVFATGTQIHIKNSPAVFLNTLESGLSQNIYLYDNNVVVDGTVSGNNKIGITVKTLDVAFACGGEAEAAFFFPDDENQEIYIDTGNLILRNKVLVATVSFDTDIVGESLPSEEIWNLQTKLIKPSLSRTGYTLVGWFCGDIQWDFNDYVDKDMFLKAKWQLNAPTVGNIIVNGIEKTEFEFNAGFSFVLSVEPCHELTAATFIYEWKKGIETISFSQTVNISKKEDGGEYRVYVFASDGINNSEKIYADLSVKSFYTVNFELKTSGNSELKIYTDDSLISAPQIEEKIGFNLNGWYTSLDEGLTFDKKWNFDTDKINFNLILYSAWELLSPLRAGILSDKTNNSTVEGAPIILSANFTHPLSEAITYQWYKAGESEVKLDNASEKTLTLKNLNEAGRYFCRATVTCEDQIKTVDSDEIQVCILAREIKSSKEIDEKISATLTSDLGIDPEANLCIKKQSIDIYMEELSKIGQIVSEIYSVELKSDTENLELPEQSVIEMSLDIENNEPIKIILLKSDGTYEEIETRQEGSKIFFATDTLGSIAVVSVSNVSSPNPSDDTENPDNQNGVDDSVISPAPPETEPYIPSNNERTKNENLYFCIGIGTACIVGVALALIIAFLNKKNKNKISGLL